MFFQDWTGLLRTLAAGLVAYAALIAILRISGKRTLSKLNAFDLVVTVALGSTLATVIVSRQTPLAEGVLALGLLVALQYAVTWTTVRWPALGRAVRAEPTLIARGGEVVETALRRERLTRDEVEAAVRQAGLADLGQAAAVFLESDGSLSVIPGPDRRA